MEKMEKIASRKDAKTQSLIKLQDKKFLSCEFASFAALRAKTIVFLKS
jgi:hypothetical protein